MKEANEEAVPSARSIPLDALKGLAIILVVLGHLFEGYPDDRLIRPFWQFVYFFHVPLLVFISGRLSRPGSAPRKLFNRLIVPYLIFNAFWYVWISLWNWQPAFSIVYPGWGLWYLLSLFCWRLALRYIKPKPGLVALAVALSLTAGFLPGIGAEFSLSRTIAFWPFFLAGYLYRERLMTAFSRKIVVRTVFVLVSTIIVSSLYVWGEGLDIALFYLKYPYSAVPGGGLMGLVFRTLYYIVAFILVWMLKEAFLFHRENNFFSQVGSGSAPVYIFHFYPVYAWMALDAPLSGLKALSACLVLAVALAWLLSRRPAKVLYQYLSLEFWLSGKGAGRP